MFVVVDTNVLISGIFWSGPPNEILKAWQKHSFELALTAEIFEGNSSHPSPAAKSAATSPRLNTMFLLKFGRGEVKNPRFSFFHLSPPRYLTKN